MKKYYAHFEMRKYDNHTIHIMADNPADARLLLHKQIMEYKELGFFFHSHHNFYVSFEQIQTIQGPKETEVKSGAV